MRKSDKIRAIIAALLLLTLMPMAITPSSAMTSPPTLYQGSRSTGTHMPIESDIVIEKQAITFDISEFPKEHTTEEYVGYDGTVTTEYTIYNPTDSEITFRAALPFSLIPDYFYGVDVRPDPTRYSATVNGVAVETDTRHIYDYGSSVIYGSGRLDSLIMDEYIDNEYCGPDMTVTKYVFEQSEVTYDSVCAAFNINPSKINNSCIYINQDFHNFTRDNGDECFYFTANENGSIYELYVFGDDLDEMPEWKFYPLGTVKSGRSINGKMELISKETMTFSSFANSSYDPTLGVTEMDWFNLLAKEISVNREHGSLYFPLLAISNFTDVYIVSGLTYNITVKPGERVTTAITAPLFPDIQIKYEPNAFHYYYKFSQSDHLSIADNVTVNINTSYYLIDGNSEEYAKNDSGYTYAQEISKYPEADQYFFFTLCESENPEEVETITPMTALFIFLFMILGFIVVAINDFINKVKGVFIR